MAPLFIEKEAVQGRAQGVVTLTNVTDQAVRVRVYSEPFTYERDGFVGLRESADDLSPYLQFSPREMVIEPGAEQRVRLLGLFPPGLAAGEYRAAVFAEELIANSEGPSSTVIRARVGSTVYMRQGELVAELTGLGADMASDRQVLELLVGNEGNATARSEVFWQLHSSENLDEAIASGQAKAKTIVAKGDRIFPLTLPETLASGSYVLSGEMRWVTLDEANTQPFELTVFVP